MKIVRKSRDSRRETGKVFSFDGIKSLQRKIIIEAYQMIETKKKKKIK